MEKNAYVIWPINNCWNKWILAKEKACGEGAAWIKGERNNLERYVGVACECNESLGFDGFHCPIQCERSESKLIAECRKEYRECLVDRKTNKPYCGCPIGSVQRPSKAQKGGFTCEKMNSCHSCKHRCHKASKCTPPDYGNKLGYSCAPCDAKLGYSGSDGIFCDNIDECSDDNLNKCDRPRAFCEDREPIYDQGLKYVCICGPGWRGDTNGGYKWRPCQDENECANGTICGLNSICVNTPGSYICKCEKGYQMKSGTINQCVDIDECRFNNPCDINANCVNEPGSFTCQCKEGFKGDGYTCEPDKEWWCTKCDEESTECVLGRDNQAYICKCRNGFQRISGNRYKCSNIPFCADPSLNDCDKTPDFATCEETPGSYKCHCNKGYEGDGKVCRPTDACEIDFPCARIAGTFCFNNNGKAICKCKPGFVRQVKNQNNFTAPCFDQNTAPVNNCSICENATSVCRPIVGGAPFMECVCREGYRRNAAGICVNINECLNPLDTTCDANAQCFDREPALHGIRYECRCNPGYTGKGTDECLEEGGRKACPLPHTHCLNVIGAYKCPCDDGFKLLKGTDICSNINECDENLAECPLMSRCIDLVPGYKCECLPGFKNVSKDGKAICENINECEVGIMSFVEVNNETVAKSDYVSACDAENGTCQDTIGSYLCDCKIGFVKDTDNRRCLDVDECQNGQNKCNRQVEECENSIGSYKCNCKYGFVKNNDTGVCGDRDECADGSNKCNKHSVCINLFGGYKCECEKGYKIQLGSHPLRPVCEREDVCASFPRICHPGKCISIDEPPFYKCQCPAAAIMLNSTKCVYPNYCDQDFPSPGNADCIKSMCLCKFGYSWNEPRWPLTIKSLKNRPPCSEINPCIESQPCADPLKCKHTGPNQYVCECPDGFELSNGECIDINECEVNKNQVTCPENSKCENLIGSYKCTCKLGYTPKIGSSLTNPTCIDVNECETGLDDCRSKNGTCVNNIGSYECPCAPGYRVQAPDYEFCRDINECKEGTSNCDKNAKCTNIPGSFYCTCNKGYMGEGESCYGIDYCNPAAPRHNCTETQLCVNLPGIGFNCTCKPGYEPTPKGCVDIDECLSLETNDCSKKGGEVRMKCINEPGIYSCVCPAGYVQMLPDKCVDINECEQKPSPCPAFEPDVCINTNGSFTCNCRDGYRKPKDCTEKTKCPCADIDECVKGMQRDGKNGPACGPDAKCENILGSFKCACSEGYEGDAYTTGCKIADACKFKNPCNQETENCIFAGDKAVCKCKDGFLLTNSNKCQKNPCLVNNGGCGKTARCIPTPVEDIIKAVCRCKIGAELDSNHECVPIDVCKCPVKVPYGSPCKSTTRCNADHMLCVNYGGAGNCTCEPGYKISTDGKECDDINECIEGVSDICTCANGFLEKVTTGGVSGTHKACEETATCFNLVGSYRCDCPRGQIEDHHHKCVKDFTCSREHFCNHDSNAFCADIDATHQYCKCNAGYMGMALERDGLCQKEDFCESAKRAVNGADVCKPNQMCVNREKKYECICKDGYEMINGECIDINECTAGIAQCCATYICTNIIGSYTCSCPKGYRENVTDHRCDEIDECKEKTDTCDRVKEQCINLPGTFQCVCKTPQFKKSPERVCVDNDECATNQYECPEFSFCNNTFGGYECICARGFKPVTKDGKMICVDIDECTDMKDVCPIHSDCKNRIGSYECICHPPAIQHGLQDCVMNASCPECHRHAFCLKSAKKGGDVYNCTCNDGYSGDGVNSCENIDECKIGLAKCHQLADCIDLDPLYECRCRQPYEGDGKNVCKRGPDCEIRNDCPKEAKCEPVEEAVEGKWVTCICPTGFKFNPKTRICDDIDECAEKPPIGPCMSEPLGVKCINTQGSYTCQCPDGHKMNTDRTKCEIIDACQNGEGTVACNRFGAKCKTAKFPQLFECICPDGFEQDETKKVCIDIDECAKKLDKCDRPTTTCQNTAGSYKCICNKGMNYVPENNTMCEDVNECVLGTHTCKPFSELCHNTIGSFVCNCSNGYIKKDKGCEIVSDCEKSIECGANAFCKMRPSKENPDKLVPECVCQDGYYGVNPKEFCDAVPDCEKDNQCPSNSKCVQTQVKDRNGRATFTCACAIGYRKLGSQCAPIHECADNPNICGPGAVCVEQDILYRCECPVGTMNTGIGQNKVTCEIPSCKSAKSPCHPDAICIDNAHGYTCRCKDGFRGPGTASLGCEEIDECKEYTLCSQYATCVNEPRGSFTCTCKAGYTGNGTICHDIDECKLNPETACDKKATCHNTQGSYRCTCKDGYSGTGLPGQCQDIDECSDPRLNKCCSRTTTCLNLDGDFECRCLPGYETAPNSSFSCVDTNECLNTTNPICTIHKCNNLPGDYNCQCNNGYKSVENGHGCVDIDECTDSHPCHVNADCANEPGGYKCTCKPDYEGDGTKSCAPKDKCTKPELNDCDKNTTNCKQIEHTSQYRCECKP
uniref:EGF-like domain-containing protein n=1 Tax=Acrobeloides nanus TaxID=290746 RepID=A0A914E086_9BILA